MKVKPMVVGFGVMKTMGGQKFVGFHIKVPITLILRVIKFRDSRTCVEGGNTSSTTYWKNNNSHQATYKSVSVHC
eukprot:9107478-Ditylum_brightwellii.AAC.2